jgi:hypothetical protein
MKFYGYSCEMGDEVQSNLEQVWLLSFFPIWFSHAIPFF